MTLKRQQFKNNKCDITKSKASKRSRIDVKDNEKGQGLDKY